MTQDKQEEVEAPEAEGAAAAGAEVAEATGAAPPGGKPSGGEPPGDRTLGTRRTVATLHASAGSLLVVAIVLMLNYLAYRHYERWDWTSDGVFTLSQRTEEVVRGLDRGIEIFVLLSEGEQELDAVRELTERYKALNPLVTVRQIDPDRQRGEYTLLAERFDLAQGPMADVAIVVAGSERHWKITRDDLLELDMGSLDSSDGPKLDVKSEQALTGAILQVVRGRATRVCASSGHGEWTLDPGGERSLAAASETLRRDNVELESLETLGLEAIPERCDALWIISPLRPLGEDEVERIGAYLEAGGNALLTLDPVLDGDRVQRTGFEGLLGVLGAFAEPCLVLEMDQARLLTPSPVQAFLTVDFGDHPTTQLLQATQGLVVMDIARSVRVIEGSTAVALIRSSEEAFGETNLADIGPDEEPRASADDIPGPLGLAVAGRHPDAPTGGSGGRFVAMGDSDWMDRMFLDDPRFGNVDLLGSVTGWLTEREELISIAPRSRSLQPLMLTEADIPSIALRVIGLMPLSVLLFGFAIWWSRRS